MKTLIYEKPVTKVTVIKLESQLLVSSSQEEDDEETCDCFAHRGNHSKCGKGCHNSGKKDNFEIDW